MWRDLGVAVALLLVIEGIVPFLSPASLRKALQAMSELDNRRLRLAGFFSMMLGLALLYLINR